MGTTADTVIKEREELESTSKIEVVDHFIAKDGRRFERKPKEPKQEEATEEGAEETEEQLEPQIAVPMLGIYQLNKAHQVDCVEGLAGLPEGSHSLPACVGRTLRRGLWRRGENVQFTRFRLNS